MRLRSQIMLGANPHNHPVPHATEKVTDMERRTGDSRHRFPPRQHRVRSHLQSSHTLGRVNGRHVTGHVTKPHTNVGLHSQPLNSRPTQSEPARVHIAWHISQTHPVIVNLGKQFHSGLKPMNIMHLPSSLLQFTDTVHEHVVASYLLRRSTASSPSHKRLSNRVPM